MGCPGRTLAVLPGLDVRRALNRDRPRSQQATNYLSAGQNRQSAVLFTLLRPWTVALLWECQNAHTGPGQSNSGIRLNPATPGETGEGEIDAARKCAFLHAFTQNNGEKGRMKLSRKASSPELSIRKAVEAREMRRLQQRPEPWPDGTARICQMNCRKNLQIAKMPIFVQCRAEGHCQAAWDSLFCGMKIWAEEHLLLTRMESAGQSCRSAHFGSCVAGPATGELQTTHLAPASWSENIFKIL